MFGGIRQLDATARLLPSFSSSFKTLVSPSPNSSTVCSIPQRQNQDAYSEARFEQTELLLQPQSLSAMEMVNKEPVRNVQGRRAICDGGGGPLGHPKLYINLDRPGTKPCGYCGVCYEHASHHGR